MSKLEKLFDDINRDGFVINMLFQSQAYGMRGKEAEDWQANLRTIRTDGLPDIFEYGRAESPCEAVQLAWEKAKAARAGGKVIKNDMPPMFKKAHVSVKPKASLDDLG